MSHSLEALDTGTRHYENPEIQKSYPILRKQSNTTVPYHRGFRTWVSVFPDFFLQP